MKFMSFLRMYRPVELSTKKVYIADPMSGAPKTASVWTQQVTRLVVGAWLLLSAGAVHSFAGVDSGGGSVVFPPKTKKPILLELYGRQAAVTDLHSSLQMVRTENIRRYQVETFSLAQERIYESLEARLELWKKSSPVLIEAIRKTLRNTRYLYTFVRLPATSRYVHTPATQGLTVETAVFYHSSIGAIFSAQIYQGLDDASRVGLFIHEALRQIQIAYSDQGDAQMGDQALQDITAKLVLESPAPGETLDRPELFGSYVQELLGTLGAGAASTHAEYCQKLKATAEILPPTTGLEKIHEADCSARIDFTSRKDVVLEFERLYRSLDNRYFAIVELLSMPEHKQLFLQLHQLALLNYLKAQNGALASNEPSLYQVRLRMELFFISSDSARAERVPELDRVGLRYDRFVK